MKAIILLLTVSVSSLAALANLQRLTSMKDQVIAALPKLEESLPSSPAPVDVPAPGSSVSSAADVVAQYGEPQRTERAMNGTTVYYYPYTVIYIQNNVVVGSRPVAGAQAPQAPITSGQRHWNSTATNGSGTSNPHWQAQTSSLGSANLNGSGSTVTRFAPSSGGWQGPSSPAPVASAPRTVVVRQSGTGVVYRATGGGSTGSSQWR